MEGLRKEAEDWAQRTWKEERDLLHTKIASLESRVNIQENIIHTLRGELLEAQSNRLEEGEIQSLMMEELNTIKEQVKVIEEEGKKKANWVEVITKTQEKVEATEKWIEVAKKGKDKEVPPTPTLINMTLEEEQRTQIRALHVRVTGLKDK